MRLHHVILNPDYSFDVTVRREPHSRRSMSPRSPRNRILSSVPADQRARIVTASEHVLLKPRTVLFDFDRPIDSVYFPLEGVVSLVSVLHDGSAVESVTIGNEGMVGLPLFLGAESMSAQAFAQVPGSAYRLPKGEFVEELEEGNALRSALSKYTQGMITLLSQNSACNRRHAIDERCARWLLLTHDRVSTDNCELTQQFLGMMLGVRRASVTLAAGVLQKAGLIRYDRGVITILDREALQQAACECYAIIHNEFARLQGGLAIPSRMSELKCSDDGQSTVDDPQTDQPT